SELLLRYDPAASEETIQQILSTLGAVEVGRIPAIGVLRILVPVELSQPAATLSTLNSRSELFSAVSSVEENRAFQLAFDPNDTFYPDQWALKGSAGSIDAHRAWDKSTRRGTGITVAVLDTGVDLEHPEFAYQLVPGWDFAADDAQPDDEDGHGTAVAGIIAARTNNGAGIAGVAYLAKIMPVRVCVNSDYDDDCYFFHVAAGIVHAVDKGAKIINLSLSGTDPSSTVEAAIQYALSRNVVVVAAAGNTSSNTITYPAAYDGVIGVGAHDEDGVIVGSSTHNANVDLSAPGVGIYTTAPLNLDPDGYDDTGAGTSLAAAHVSGAAALLMSANIATTPPVVRDALICGAYDAGDDGYDDYYGFGRLNINTSMNWAGNSAACKITLTNDSAQTPTRIPRAPYTATQLVDSRNATTQAADPQICGASREQTAWFTFQPGTAGVYQISTWGSSYPTVLGVFYG
ncbi:MAG: S8 family serine peptidase, partial [Anaerolineae bacterium]|nr:S8 family serine peptidase [Anaerolineae bacterium]